MRLLFTKYILFVLFSAVSFLIVAQNYEKHLITMENQQELLLI